MGRHFADEGSTRKVITGGPYRFLRHPRYAGLILTRIAFALTFASILGWLFMIGWTLVVLRRINLEEPHLREIFGTEYDIYAGKTEKLIPGIY
ncbi:MAG: isoprenylcysteine carboxylmethyltransferase family protein [Blastocatellia bacterium]|nr:isoprenylcysteine carboxylmethyltransferase family protein [Blastocatellia bacterium]